MADGKQFWHTLPSRSCRIDHNNIINAGQLAVVIGGYDNVFEYNINQGNWHHYPAADDDGAANGISTMFSSNPIIRYNVNVGTHRNAQQGDGCGFFVDHLTYNGQIYGNFSLHNDGGGVCIRKSYNTKIFNNMLYANAQVYGIGITSGGIWVFNDAPPSDQYTEVFNNILLDNKYADVCASDVSAASPLQIRFHHNLYFSNERAALFRLQEKKPEQDQLLDYRHDFSAWQAMGFDAASMWADPKLRDPANDQFQLTSRSPCISAGIPSADNLRIFPARLDYALENMSSDFLSFLLVEQDTARGCALGPYLFSAKNDTDTDGIENDADMCPATPDGPMLGTCVKQFGDTYIGTDMVCTDSSDCGVNYTCQMSQDDLNLNGIADACECQADITGPVRVLDGRVNSFDMMVMKKEIKGTPCLADINCDNKVDGFDLAILKVQFNKAGCFLP